MSGKTTIPFFDGNKIPRNALAGSDPAGNFVTGHTAFDVNGNPLNVATKESVEALGVKVDTSNTKLTSIGDNTLKSATALGTVDDLPATPGDPATVIGLLKGIFTRMGGVVLAASTAIIGRTILADANGLPYSGTNRLRVSNEAIEPSNDSFPVVVDHNYATDYPQGFILRSASAGSVDVTTLSGNRRTMNFIAGETRSVRVLKVWTDNTTVNVNGLEGMP